MDGQREVDSQVSEGCVICNRLAETSKQHAEFSHSNYFT